MPKGQYERTEEIRRKLGKYVRTEESKRKQSITMKGRKLSEEAKRKVSESLKGNKRALGFIHSEETKRRLSEIQKGRRHTKKTKLKMSEVQKGNKKNLGQIRSQETRQKISNILKGKNTWSKGSHRSEELRRKMSEVEKGNKGPNWKGGISPLNMRIRKGIEFRLWREAVFSRDNWTCQKCIKRGAELHPHHVKNFAQYPELRFAIDNGITLCRKCHKEFHNRYGQQNNEKEQIGNFL